MKKLEILVKNALNLKNNEKLKFIPLGGMTNTNFLLQTQNGEFVVRKAEIGLEKIIDRQIESQNAKLMSDLQIDEKLLFYDAKSGFKISKAVSNAKTLTPQTATQYLPSVAQTLKNLHALGAILVNDFNTFEWIEKYEERISALHAQFYEGYFTVKKDFFNLSKELQNKIIPKTACHCDCVPENFVLSDAAHKKLFLVDWEYAGNNDPLWDLATFCTACNLNFDDENNFFTAYFNRKIDQDELFTIRLYQIAQGILSALWAIVQESNGKNLGFFGTQQLANAKNLILQQKKNPKHF